MRPLTTILAVLFAGALHAARPDGPIVCPALDRAVVVDGDLAEWLDHPEIRIDAAEQRNLFEGNPISLAWGGPDDASAVIYVARGGDQLYLAGQVRDDARVHDDQIWWRGDCLELFLDLDREGDRAEWKWNEDDYQICLMPYDRGRPWGVSMHGSAPLLSDAGIEGLEIAARATAGAGYTFEARVPLARLSGFDPERTVIGFNVAVHDYDRTDGGDRHSYLTINGKARNYADTRNLLDLVFTGEAQARSERDDSFPGVLRWILVVVAVLGAIALIGWQARPVFEWVTVRLQSWRRIGVSVLGLVGFLVLVLPVLVTRWLEWRLESDFADRVQLLSHVLADLGEEARRHEGRGLDDPRRIVDLLRGRRVDVRPHYHPTCFELRPADVDPNLRRSDDGLPVRDYGFALPARVQLAFPLPEPTTLDRVYVFGGADLDERFDQPGAPPGREHALEIGVRLADGSEPVEAFRLVDQRRFVAGFLEGDAVQRAWTEQGRTILRYELDDARVLRDVLVDAILVRLRDPAATFFLHGVTLVPAGDGAAPEPLSLARTSLAGPPAALWPGTRSRDVIVRGLSPAARHLVPIDADLDVLWVFYTSQDDRVLEPELNGVEVGRFIVGFDDGSSEVVALRAGVNITAARYDPKNRADDMESRLAFHEKTADGAPIQIDLLEIPLRRDDRPRHVRDLVLENAGRVSSLTLAAVTGGRRSTITAGDRSLLVDGGDTVELRTQVAGSLDAIDVVVYEGGRVAAADMDDAELGASLAGARYPLGGVDGQRGAEGVYVAELGVGRYLVKNVPLARRDGDPMHVTSAVEVPGLERLRRLQRKIGFASIFLIVPILLFFVLDFVTRRVRLRPRLTSLLVATSLMPIVLLFAVLYNVVAGDRARVRETRAETELGEIQARFGDMRRQVTRVAREVMDKDVVRRMKQGERPAAGDVSSFLREVVALDPVPGLDLSIRVEVEDESGARTRYHDDPALESASRFDVTERGLHRHWGRLVVVGSDADRSGRDGVRVTVAGEVQPRLVDDLARSSASRVTLRSLDGLALAGDALTTVGVDPSEIETIRERNRPLLRAGAGGELVALDLLRDPSGEPAALIELAVPDAEFLVDVVFASWPLEEFFFWFGVLVLAAAVFMGAVATGRITEPVVALESAAQRIAAGDLDVRVETDSQGEVARLANAFNQMADTLKRRDAERSRLDRALLRLNRTIDPRATADAALSVLCEQPAPIEAAVYARDGDRLTRLGDTATSGSFPAEMVLPSDDPLWSSREPMILGPETAGRLGQYHQASTITVALPLSHSQRVRGLALLRYSGRAASDVDEAIPTLGHLAGQVATAFENSRLYRLAIVDPATGAYVESYFRNRLEEEVDRAQHLGVPLSILRVEPIELDQWRRARGDEGVREALARLLGMLRAELREMFVIGRSRGAFLVLLPETGRDRAAEFQERVRRRIDEEGGTPSDDGFRITAHVGSATFPDDGRSTAFLFDAAARDLAESHRRKVERALEHGDENVAPALDTHPYVFESPRMRSLLAQVARLAPSSASALLLGETGVGKEVIADLLHRWSDRAHRRMVAINCSAMPETLLEAELFGYEKGAFTGATQGRPGQLEAAHGGTIFLDEVGDMPLPVQAKLLRVLQDQRVVRLGGRRPILVDVRVVAATNRDLAKMIERGIFRRDLYFRLKVVELVVPPLRDRREDIPALVDACVKEFGREGGRTAPAISPAALDRLHRYHWPGNVRELRNVLRRAMLLTEGDLVLPSALHFEAAPGPAAGRASPRTMALPPRVADDLNERQRRLLERLRPGDVILGREYFDMVGVSPRTGLRDLNDLLDRGILERIGRRRAAAYRLGTP